jgi:HEAT repeat protein
MLGAARRTTPTPASPEDRHMFTAHLLTLALQAPGWCCGCSEGGASTTPGQTSPDTYNPAGPAQPRSPGDTVPSNPGGARPAPGGSTPAPGPGGPRTGGAPNAPSPAGPSTAMPRATSMAMTSDDGWWLWWEYNKTEFLKPRRRPLSDMVLSMDGDESLRRRLESARAALLAIGEAGVKDADAGLRQSAVLSIGRVGEHAAHDELVAALADANQDVRHAALLALGASGSEAAQATLSRIAREGRLARESGRISPYARPLAVVALGLGRRAGFDELATQVALDACKQREGAEGDMLAAALFMHHAMAPDVRILGMAVAVAKDEREAPATRCRAIEALRGSDEPLVVDALAKLVADGRMDVRRSAALALGSSPRLAAFSALRKALEGEKEPLTRGLVLASMARRGEPGVWELLAEQLKAPQSNQRAWAALALGVHARGVALEAATLELVRKSLRQARAGEKDDYTLAALDLAAGLVRDPEQYAEVHEASTKGQSPERRNYAMTAMSLYGDQSALDALGARVLAEADSVARLGGATALAVHGRAEDAPIFVALLEQHRARDLQAQAAQVLGLHGTTAALDALLAASVDQKADRAVRAAAVQGLGLLLTRPQALAFADVSRQANYTVLPEWVRPLFYTTL